MDSRGKVLVVEDEVKIRTLITLYLEKNMYQVMEATNGSEALQLVEEERPDALILDVLMPILSGIQVCRLLRKDPTYEDIPILFLSSLNEKAAIIQGLEAGGDDYITKPFDPNELIARVNSLMRRVKKTNISRHVTLMYEELTSQEMNVLKLMERGYTNKEIADQLFLTVGTVKVYSHNIYQKLQVRNRTQAIVKAKDVALI